MACYLVFHDHHIRIMLDIFLQLFRLRWKFAISDSRISKLLKCLATIRKRDYKKTH